MGVGGGGGGRRAISQGGRQLPAQSQRWSFPRVLPHLLGMLEDTCLCWMHLWRQIGVRDGGLQDEAKVELPSRCRR
jgi:hypothetical protein